MIHGKLGSGKTLLATLLCFLLEKDVFANYTIKIPNIKFKKFGIGLIFDNLLSNITLILDEAYVYLESRFSMSKTNKLMSYLMFQSRKRNLDIILTAQLQSTIELRYREMIDITIECVKSIENQMFIYKWETDNRIGFFSIPFEKAIEIYNYYDTNEIVSSESVDNMRYEELTYEQKEDIVEKNYEKYLNFKKLNKQNNDTLKFIRFFCKNNKLPFTTDFVDSFYYYVKRIKIEELN